MIKDFPPESIIDLYQTFLKDSCRYKKQQNQQTEASIYYFAYGSTLNQTCLEDKIGHVEFITKAVLRGFQLTFAQPFFQGSPKATLLPKLDASVEGAVYKITEEQLALLDQAKKTHSISHRLRLYVNTHPLKPPIAVEVYTYNFYRDRPYQSPRLDYMQNMEKGAQKIKISKEYAETLELHSFHAHSKL